HDTRGPGPGTWAVGGGGEGGIRTHEAFARWFSRPEPSTTRPPLRGVRRIPEAPTPPGATQAGAASRPSAVRILAIIAVSWVTTPPLAAATRCATASTSVR